jgi:hypothetical protein
MTDSLTVSTKPLPNGWHYLQDRLACVLVLELAANTLSGRHGEEILSFDCFEDWKGFADLEQTVLIKGSEEQAPLYLN